MVAGLPLPIAGHAKPGTYRFAAIAGFENEAGGCMTARFAFAGNPLHVESAPPLSFMLVGSYTGTAALAIRSRTSMATLDTIDSVPVVRDSAARALFEMDSCAWPSAFDWFSGDAPALITGEDR